MSALGVVRIFEWKMVMLLWNETIWRSNSASNCEFVFIAKYHRNTFSTIIIDHIWFVLMKKRCLMKNNDDTQHCQHNWKVGDSTQKIKMRSQIYDLLWCDIRDEFWQQNERQHQKSKSFFQSMVSVGVVKVSEVKYDLLYS